MDKKDKSQGDINQVYKQLKKMGRSFDKNAELGADFLQTPKLEQDAKQEKTTVLTSEPNSKLDENPKLCELDKIKTIHKSSKMDKLSNIGILEQSFNQMHNDSDLGDCDEAYDYIDNAKEDAYTAKEPIKPRLHIGHRSRMDARVRLDPNFETFAPHEMIEYLLYIGVPRQDTNELAHRLITHFGGFSNVFYASMQDLLQVKGMTERAAGTIVSVLPIARWVYNQNLNRQQIKISTTQQAIDFLRPYFHNQLVESVFLACLDSADYLINVFSISKGAASRTLLDCRQVVSKANLCMASKAILAHNHPAGTLTPSIDDIAATSRVAAGLGAIYVSLIDHIIFTPNDEVFSFYKEGVLFDILNGSDEILGGDMLSEVYSAVAASDMLKLNRKKNSKFLQDIYKKVNSGNYIKNKDKNYRY